MLMRQGTLKEIFNTSIMSERIIFLSKMTHIAIFIETD